jgi:hypothetical protein
LAAILRASSLVSRMVVATIALQSVGMLLGAAVAIAILYSRLLFF